MGFAAADASGRRVYLRHGASSRFDPYQLTAPAALALLKDGGRFEIEVPYERALTAWQDPTHVRAMNEKSWLYYTDWFWYLGWFEHRF